VLAARREAALDGLTIDAAECFRDAAFFWRALFAFNFCGFFTLTPDLNAMSLEL
jgi:hypothetical protein